MKEKEILEQLKKLLDGRFNLEIATCLNSAGDPVEYRIIIGEGTANEKIKGKFISKKKEGEKDVVYKRDIRKHTG